MKIIIDSLREKWAFYTVIGVLFLALMANLFIDSSNMKVEKHYGDNNAYTVELEGNALADQESIQKSSEQLQNLICENAKLQKQIVELDQTNQNLKQTNQEIKQLQTDVLQDINKY